MKPIRVFLLVPVRTWHLLNLDDTYLLHLRTSAMCLEVALQEESCTGDGMPAPCTSNETANTRSKNRPQQSREANKVELLLLGNTLCGCSLLDQDCLD